MENSKKDMAQDKATVKKAFRMHDAQEHKGEHTDLSKLKKGGKMVKKFAEGGTTTGAAAATGKDAMKTARRAERMKDRTDRRSAMMSRFGDAMKSRMGAANTKAAAAPPPAANTKAGAGLPVKTAAKGGKMKRFAAGGVTKQMPTSKDMGSMNMAKGGKIKRFAIGGLGTMSRPMARPGVAPTKGPMVGRPVTAAPTIGLKGPAPVVQTPTTGQGFGTGTPMYDMPAPAPLTGIAPIPRGGLPPAVTQAMTQAAMAPTFKKGGKIMAKKACGGKMASGGSFRTSANGVASKGKTKGTQVKMYAKGGSVSPDGCAVKGKTRAPGFR